MTSFLLKMLNFDYFCNSGLKLSSLLPKRLPWSIQCLQFDWWSWFGPKSVCGAWLTFVLMFSTKSSFYLNFCLILLILAAFFFSLFVLLPLIDLLGCSCLLLEDLDVVLALFLPFWPFSLFFTCNK